VLYHLLFPLSEQFAALNVFRYITFRSAGAIVTAVVLSLVLGPWFIRRLQSFSIGQSIREEGPERHRAKAGTPTMGGLLILFSVLLSTLLWAKLSSPLVWLVMAVTVSFGLIGFADDWLKIRRRHNRGLSAATKLLLQTLVGVVVAVVMLQLPEGFEVASTVALPFFKNEVFNIGWLFVPFVALLLVGSSNAVNLTDGLDGLAIGAVLIAAATYGIFAYVAGNAVVAEYLQVPFVSGAGEVAIFCSALVGASIGFLWFNAHPAEVFMGDVGSIALGGAIGTVAVLAKQEIVLVLVGGLFVIEALSVIVQVASFKLTGKRVFRMAPIHHHFELSGWSEPKIIVRFWILAFLFSLIGLSTLKLR